MSAPPGAGVEGRLALVWTCKKIVECATIQHPFCMQDLVAIDHLLLDSNDCKLSRVEPAKACQASCGWA